jgi:hypothetical protein
MKLDVTRNEALFAVRVWCDLAAAGLSRGQFGQAIRDARRAREWLDVATALTAAEGQSAIRNPKPAIR